MFDSVRQVVWLIGRFGTTRGGPPMETWKWDGHNWAQVVPRTSPPRGFSPLNMAFDHASGHVVTIMYTKAGQGGVPEAET